MKFKRNYIKVRFEANDRITLGDTGVTLIRPEKWVERDRNGEIKVDDRDGTTKFGYNVDCKETNPQICVVTASNDKYPYRVGDRLFCHYMAFETGLDGNIETLEGIIDAEFVFFTIVNNEIGELAPDMYIGEAIINNEVVSPSGILVEQGKRDSLKVRLTHVCKPFYKNLPEITGLKAEKMTIPCAEVGDVVVSIDQYNYDFTFNGKKLVKLTSKEIAGIYIEE